MIVSLLMVIVSTNKILYKIFFIKYIKTNLHLIPFSPTSHFNENEKIRPKKREEILFDIHYLNRCTPNRMWRPTCDALAYRGRGRRCHSRKNARLYQIHRSLDAAEEILLLLLLSLLLL